MSCCGMPRKSGEPEYPVPRPLLGLLMEWERYCPGIGRAVEEEIATGDWDRQEGVFVPAYTIEGAFDLAQRTLQQHLIARESARLHREGPWLIRLGLAKPPQSLNQADESFFAQAVHAVEALRGANQYGGMGGVDDEAKSGLWTWNSGSMPVAITFEGFDGWANKDHPATRAQE